LKFSTNPTRIQNSDSQQRNILLIRVAALFAPTEQRIIRAILDCQADVHLQPNSAGFALFWCM
jgi:hypothetical protein